MQYWSCCIVCSKIVLVMLHFCSLHCTHSSCSMPSCSPLMHTTVLHEGLLCFEPSCSCCSCFIYFFPPPLIRRGAARRGAGPAGGGGPLFCDFNLCNTGTVNALVPPAAAGAPGIRLVTCTQLIKCNRHTTVPQAEAVDQLQANANEKGEQRGYPTIPDHVRHLHCILWLLTNCI